jgi:phage FluMu protein Com
MKDETKRWIDAGKLLAVNPHAEVLCPRCQAVALIVTDVSPPSDPTLVERHMQCPRCEAYNALRLRR